MKIGLASLFFSFVLRKDLKQSEPRILMLSHIVIIMLSGILVNTDNDNNILNLLYHIKIREKVNYIKIVIIELKRIISR